MHQEEVPHARRDFLDQVSVGQVLAQAWRPGVLPWAVHALRAGGTTHVPVCEPQAFPAPGALDLPGAPVPVHTSQIKGPQLLPDMFHTDRARALDSLAVIEGLDAGLILRARGQVK
ncbi:hypothetical protein SSP24_03910 [Streptomyces spinoverrucosus]|uniref:Uncharacterized protein n=1 Tax=Streptomyces spinoverrucosus TaxID=284043 RepID=A0A4Y3VCM8_9ACTN|nr:hypothetical protein SSP24_03910 [Streptomyces spinoverrucosus]GHB40828.1 hypothetical protein GCM10010397_08690 [Streptomyces spinoverrucosus]